MDETIDTPTIYNPQSTRYDITTADFKLFVVVWNQRTNQRTPDIHLKMAEWLEWNWRQGNTRLLMMAFRSAGKIELRREFFFKVHLGPALFWVRVGFPAGANARAGRQADGSSASSAPPGRGS